MMKTTYNMTDTNNKTCKRTKNKKIETGKIYINEKEDRTKKDAK